MPRTILFPFSDATPPPPLAPYRTSDEVGGPAYSWTSIVSTGALLAVSDNDEGKGSISLTGFTFPFYGNNISVLWVTTNGYIQCGVAGDGIEYYSNHGTFPDGYDSNYSFPLLMGPFGADMVAAAGIYTQEFSDHVVIQWNMAKFYGGWGQGDPDSNLNFQAILWSSGIIQFVYETMTPKLGGTLIAQIGFQETTTKGLGISDSYGDAVVHSNLLIQIPAQA